MWSCKTKVRRRLALAPPQALLNHKPWLTALTASAAMKKLIEEARRATNANFSIVPSGSYICPAMVFVYFFHEGGRNELFQCFQRYHCIMHYFVSMKILVGVKTLVSVKIKVGAKILVAEVF